MRLGGGTALSDATPSVPPQVPVEDKEAARSLVHSILALFPIQDIPRTRVLYWNLTSQAELLPCRCGYKAPILWSRLSSATHQLQPGSHVCRRVSPGRLWATPHGQGRARSSLRGRGRGSHGVEGTALMALIAPILSTILATTGPRLE